MSPASDESRELLESRARVLARPPEPARRAATRALVTFALAGETCGVEARHVLGIFRLLDLAPLPGAPAFVVGLTSWRGRLIRVLDLRLLLGLPGAGLDDRVWVLVLGGDGPAFGLLAGAVREVVEAAEEEVLQVSRGAGVDRGLVRGVTAGAVLVLDAERLLDERF